MVSKRTLKTQLVYVTPSGKYFYVNVGFAIKQDGLTLDKKKRRWLNSLLEYINRKIYLILNEAKEKI